MVILVIRVVLLVIVGAGVNIGLQMLGVPWWLATAAMGGLIGVAVPYVVPQARRGSAR